MRAFAVALAVALAGCQSNAGDPVQAIPGSEGAQVRLALPETFWQKVAGLL